MTNKTLYPEAMDLLTLSEQIRRIAVEHGWEEDERTEGDWTALAHSEISEAFEEYRQGNGPNRFYYTVDEKGISKPEGMAVEYIDAVIRILHWFAKNGINPNVIMIEKLAYNETRSYKHGGKTL